MAFQGSLSELPLPDIIQLVSVSGKTGRFELTWDHRAGQIYLRNGQIVHATVISRPDLVPDIQSGESGGAEMSGEEAIYELATWIDGDFVFTPGEESTSETIDKPNTNLLMEAARRMDEWQVLRKRIQSTAMIPQFSVQNSATSVTFSARQWALVQQVNGRRSIEEIALALGESPFSTSKDLFGLLTAGHLDLAAPISGALRGALATLSVGAGQSLAEALERAAIDLAGSKESEPRLVRSAKLAQVQIKNGRVLDGIFELLHDHERVLQQQQGEESVAKYRSRLNTLLDIE